MFGPPKKHLKMNVVPEGGAQSAPARPRGAFGGPPQRKGGDWGRKAVLAMKALTELDPRYRGNFQQQQDVYAQQDAKAAEEARKQQFAKILENMGKGNLAGLDMNQMGVVSGFERQNVMDDRYADETAYSRERDASSDAFRDRSYADSRTDRADDVAFRVDRAVIGDQQWSAEHGLRQEGLDLQRQTFAAEQAAEEGPDVKGESALRKEFFGQNKGFQEVQRAYDRIVSTDPTNAAGQMSLIFQYMKMMDPGSTVREGEFANAQNTTGIPGQVLNAYNRAARGEYLNPTQVSEFQTQAQSLYGAAADEFERSFQQYRTTSDQYGFDQGRTIPDLRNPDYQTAPVGGPTGPAIGTVEEGHRYIGGDPSQPSSWEPI